MIVQSIIKSIDLFEIREKSNKNYLYNPDNSYLFMSVEGVEFPSISISNRLQLRLFFLISK